jgi:hypothetical protein
MRELLPPLTTNLIAGMTSAFAAGLTGPAARGPAQAGEAWADYFARFMNAARPAAGEAKPAADAPPRVDPEAAAHAAAMMALGREIAEQNARTMQSIVDAFLKPGDAKGKDKDQGEG